MNYLRTPNNIGVTQLNEIGCNVSNARREHTLKPVFRADGGPGPEGVVVVNECLRMPYKIHAYNTCTHSHQHLITGTTRKKYANYYK